MIFPSAHEFRKILNFHSVDVFLARYKQQTMQLDMARQQRDMMITTQAAQMTADAQQHKLQIDMQPSPNCSSPKSFE